MRAISTLSAHFSAEDMKAIILAAGRGSRMGALTADRPKCFAEIAGRTLLSLQMQALSASADSIAVVRGYRAEVFDGLPLHRFDNPRWAETNMVRSLMCADPWLRAH